MRRAAALAIPPKFIQGCLGDMMEARRRWDITRKWREEFEIDQVHDINKRMRWSRSARGSQACV
jgi:predicted transcriptional regulator